MKNANIDVVILLAHSSHVTQPLDVVAFGSMTAFERRMGAPGNHLELLKRLRSALNTSMNFENIESSFRKAGTYPLDQERVITNPMVFPSESLPKPKPRRNTVNINAQAITTEAKILELAETQASMGSSRKRYSEAEAPEKRESTPRQYKCRICGVGGYNARTCNGKQ